MNFSELKARVTGHETRLKIVAAKKAVSSQIVTSEVWRSGGGVVPRSTERATLVRYITDSNYEGFGMVARHGQGID